MWGLGLQPTGNWLIPGALFTTECPLKTGSPQNNCVNRPSGFSLALGCFTKMLIPAFSSQCVQESALPSLSTLLTGGDSTTVVLCVFICPPVSLWIGFSQHEVPSVPFSSALLHRSVWPKLFCQSSRPRCVWWWWWALSCKSALKPWNKEHPLLS